MSSAHSHSQESVRNEPVEWDVNFRGNLRLWPEPTDVLAALAQFDGEPGEPLMLESLTINHDGRTVLEFPDGRLERWASWESMLACYGTVTVTEFISFHYVDGSLLAETVKRAIRDGEIMIEHVG